MAAATSCSYERVRKPERALLVDTRAERWHSPIHLPRTSQPSSPQTLGTANGNNTQTYGKRHLWLQLPWGVCNWNFVLVGVTKPLQNKFLRSNSLLDLVCYWPRRHFLHRASTLPLHELLPKSTCKVYANRHTQVSRYATVPPNTTSHPYKIFTFGLSHENYHQKNFPAKQEFQKLLDMGIVHRFSRPWPFLRTPKQYGDCRSWQSTPIHLHTFKTTLCYQEIKCFQK